MRTISYNIIWQFIEWFFYDQPKKLLKTWKGFLLFNLEYFSVFLLLKTLIKPWRQYTWAYPRGFDFLKYLEVFLSNIISCIIGMILRIPIILAGILFEILILIIGFLLFIGWFVLPVLLTFLLIKYAQ